MQDFHKETYSKIGRIWCPRLGGFINFNRAGFQHLIRKRGVVRPKDEQRQRLSLLKYAEGIIKDPSVVIKYEIKNVELSSAEFWTFHKKEHNKIIILTVRQIGKGEKHFFSIYSKSTKNQPSG